MEIDFLSYIEKFIHRIALPVEAINEICEVETRIILNKNANEVFSECKNKFMSKQITATNALEKIGKLHKMLAVSEYLLHFVFLIDCTDVLLKMYKDAGIDEQIYWDLMEDFRFKLMECHEVYGIWGTFCAEWLAGHMDMTRFSLGLFQYEAAEYKGSPYVKNGFMVNKGDKVYNFHLPSSGRHIDKALRLESYKKAYDFFGFREGGGIMCLVFDSWLLNKNLAGILPPTSRILDFVQDFDIISSTETETFNEAWRVFGSDWDKPLEKLPRDTTLRKVVAEYLISGGKLGSGYGIILFDGEKIMK